MLQNNQKIFKPTKIDHMNNQSYKKMNEQPSMFHQDNNQQQNGIRLLKQGYQNQMLDLNQSHIQSSSQPFPISLQNKDKMNNNSQIQAQPLKNNQTNTPLNQQIVGLNKESQNLPQTNINQNPYFHAIPNNKPLQQRNRIQSVMIAPSYQQDRFIVQQNQNSQQNNSQNIYKQQIQPLVIKQQQQLLNNSFILNTPTIANVQQINNQQQYYHSRQHSTNSIATTVLPSSQVIQNQLDKLRKQDNLQQKPQIIITQPENNSNFYIKSAEKSDQKEYSIDNKDQFGIIASVQESIQKQQNNESHQNNNDINKSIQEDRIQQKDDNSFNKNENSYGNDELISLRNEIIYLQDKLKLKEEEVNIFQQYVVEKRGIEKQNQSLMQQLEEANVQAQYFKIQQQSKENNNNSGNSIQDKEKIYSQQEEIVILNKELQKTYQQLQHQEQQIHNLDKNNSELKRQLEDKNEIISKQKEDIILLQSRINSSPIRSSHGDSNSNLQYIYELEEKYEIQALKIQSLERNLVILETENRKIKRQQQDQNSSFISEKVENH